MSDELQDILEQYRAMKEQVETLRKALVVARGQICLLGGDPNPRDKFADGLQVGALRAIDDALAKATGEPPCAA